MAISILRNYFSNLDVLILPYISTKPTIYSLKMRVKKTSGQDGLQPSFNPQAWARPV